METFNKIRNTGVLFVNKMDQEGTDCGKLLAELKSRFSEGCIDFGRVETGAEEVIEEIAVCDEQTMEEYLEKGSVAVASIRRLVADRKIFPCYFGSALHLQGVEELMERDLHISDAERKSGSIRSEGL